MSSLAAFAGREFEAFRDLVRNGAGLQFDESRREALRLAVRARATACGDKTFQDYLARLRGPGQAVELSRLLDLLTIQETYFFRNPEHFQALAERILPHPHAPSSRQPIRIWSAGCATGEEPYSIALTLLEAGMRGAEVVGTDVSETALEIARRGRYGRRAVRLVPEPLLARYFTTEGDRYVVGEAVRSLVRFEHLNLIQEPFPVSRFAGCHAIFCRNVLIYLAPESVQRLVVLLAQCLAPGHALFLGASETLWQLSDEFELVEWAGSFYYRRRAPVSAPGPPADRAAAPQILTPPAPRTSRERRRRAPAPPPPPKSGLEQAVEAIRAGDVQAASAVLEAAAAGPEADAESLILLGYLRLCAGSTEAAAELARRARSMQPCCADTHVLEGLIAREEGREAAAVAAFKRALYLQPASALARYQLAQHFAHCGDRRKAEREAAEAIRLLDAGAAPSVLSAAYPAESLRRACCLTRERVQAAVSPELSAGTG